MAKCLSNFEESSGSSDDGFSKMTAHDGKPERIVRRGGRRGRRPATIDSKAKLERSRQSARECRARKKLRYQYLEELVTSREKSIYALRDELEMMKLWCVSIDSNKVPPEIYDFLEKEKDQTSIVYPLNPGSQSLDKSSFDKFVKRAVQEVKGKSLNKLGDRGKESMCSSLATDSSMAGPSQQKLDHRVVIAPRIKIVSGTTVLPSIDKQRDADDCKSLTSSSCDSIPEMTGFSRSRSSDIRSDLTFESLLPDSP